ncbi:MAG: hypothetical protein DRH33_00525 [Candidatus Nealsonbacteria bacterium]|nr:MAG: hypothetical protein DRH33_00525 [Candidatus Nealsonbacteria bacterium]
MKKKSIIIILILAGIAGGFFYFWEVWLPAQIEKEQQIPEEKTQPPTLFRKEDYKIEEREDGKYIVVEKVGLTVKVPEGWRVEYKRTADIEPQYWIDLLSPDAEIKDILIKGCGISLVVGTTEEMIKKIKENIKFIQENPEKSKEIHNNHRSELIEINGYLGLKGITKTQILGESIAIDIPVGEKNLVHIDTLFPLGFKEKCFPTWEEFIKNTKID